MEKNYNGVTIEKSWSLVAFAKEFGTPKLAKCVNKETGESFESLAFDNGKGDITFCHFGYSTQGMTARELVQQKDSIKIGLNSNGNYTAYKQDGAWETLDIL
jgi:hypothetical protein